MVGIINSTSVSAMGLERLSVSDKQAAVMAVLALCSHASSAVQNGAVVFVISSVYDIVAQR